MALNGARVGAVRLASVLEARPDGPERLAELRLLLERHASAGSPRAAELLGLDSLAGVVWLVEPRVESVLEPVSPAGGLHTATRPVASRQPSMPAPT